MPSHVVDFTKILILCRLGVDSYVKFLNKLTLAARRDKKKYNFLSDDPSQSVNNRKIIGPKMSKIIEK